MSKYNFYEIPSQSELKDIFIYDENTGEFFWKNCIKKKLIGKKAGCISVYGYKLLTINKKLYKAHRVAWVYFYGYEPVDQIDHINGDRSDNRIINLREASTSQNGMNSISVRNTSGLKGVMWHKRSKKWISNIRVNGKKLHLGYFDCKYVAHEAYKNASKKYHGEFSMTGVSHG